MTKSKREAAQHRGRVNDGVLWLCGISGERELARALDLSNATFRTAVHGFMGRQPRHRADNRRQMNRANLGAIDHWRSRLVQRSARLGCDDSKAVLAMGLEWVQHEARDRNKPWRLEPTEGCLQLGPSTVRPTTDRNAYGKVPA